MKTKRTTITPTLKAQIIALREAGYTNISISKRLGVGVRTVHRHLDRAGVKKGSLKSELIEQARADALNLLRSDQAIKEAIAQLLLDDLAHVHHLREILIDASEYLKPTDVKTAAMVMRGAAAYATALKATSDVLQKHLNKRDQPEMQDLPELVVREISAEEALAMNEYGMMTDSDTEDIHTNPIDLEE